MPLEEIELQLDGGEQPERASALIAEANRRLDPLCETSRKFEIREAAGECAPR